MQILCQPIDHSPLVLCRSTELNQLGSPLTCCVIFSFDFLNSNYSPSPITVLQHNDPCTHVLRRRTTYVTIRRRLISNRSKQQIVTDNCITRELQKLLQYSVQVANLSIMIYRSIAAVFWSLSDFICCVSTISSSQSDSIFGSSCLCEEAFYRMKISRSFCRSRPNGEHLKSRLHFA